MGYAIATTNFTEDIVQDLKDKVIAECTYVAVGSDNSTPQPSDTTLGNEFIRKARQEYTELNASVIVSGYLDSTEGNGNTATESGTFDASSGGNMKTKFLVEPLVKTDSKELWIDNETKFTVIQESET